MEEINLIDRLEGELDFEYKLRLCSLKLNKEIDLDWSEIVELLGLTISGDHLRKLSYGYKECEQYLQDTRYIERETLAEHIERESKLGETEVEVKSLTDEDERIQVKEIDGKYLIYTKKRSILIEIDKVRKIKELYSDTNPLTINELCRKLDIARRDFMLLKQGLSICHSDVPYIDQDIQEDNIDFLVSETLERRKEKYFIKLQNEEITQMKTELSKYRKQDYLFEKIVDKVIPLEIAPTKYSSEINQSVPYREALLDLADLHLGEKFSNYWCEYSVQIARDRFNKLTQETIKTCAELGVRVLHVSNLGDDITGIIHDSLTREAEIPVEEQVTLAVELIGKMLIELSLVFDKIVYTDVFGNHSRIYVDKGADSEKSNFEFFVSWGLKLKLQNYTDKIKFEGNVIDGTIIVKEVNGVEIFQVHGNYDKFEKVASNLTMMIRKPMEIHIGHFHSNKSMEVHDVEVFQTRSFIGTNSYAKNIRVNSKAGQRLFIYEQGVRKYINDIVLN